MMNSARPTAANALAVAIPVNAEGLEGKGLEKVQKFQGKAKQSIAEEPRSPSRRKVVGNSETFSACYTPPDEVELRRFLKGEGWPYGLQTIVQKSCERYPIRYFIIDDSGSMNTNDGHRVVGGGDVKKLKMIKCTRWSELTTCLAFHADLSHAATAPTEFRFLNMAEPIIVGSPTDSTGEGLKLFKKLIEEEGPGGQTPLCEQVKAVISSIKKIEEDLRRFGQKACVIVATDGEATDGDLVEAMTPLQHLPVWLVVRCCTDEEEIIKYWNNIDAELEIEMDVLDDLAGEAKEIREANPWIYYHSELHRLREFGSAMKELDLIDESLLSSEQMVAVVSALLCDEGDPKLPLPDVNFSEFISIVKRLSAQRPLIFDPILKVPAPPINVARLSASYDANPSRACSIQ